MNAFPLEQAIEQPLTVSPETPLLEVIHRMHQASQEESANVLITAAGRLLGTFSDRDVVRLVATGKPLASVTIAQVMTPPAITLSVEQLQDTQSLLRLLNHQLNGVPVVDAHNHLLGVVRRDRCLQLLNLDQSVPTQVEQAIYRQTEAALQENQRLLWTLMSNLPGMVYRCLHDAQWTMEFVSAGCFELTGYCPEALLNSQISFEQIIHPDDRQSVRQIVQAALDKQQPFQTLYRIFTAAKTEKWIWEQGRGVFAKNGALLAIEGFMCDVTERERARQEREQVKAALLKSEATNRALIAAMPDLLIRLNREGTYLDFLTTKDFKVIMPDPHMQGKNLFEVMPLHIAQQRMHYMEQALETGKTQVYEYELTIDGQVQYEEARVVVSGKDEVLVIVRDISDRKRAEIALRDSEQLLRTVVGNTPTILYAIDRQGIFTLSEGKGLESIGLQPGQVVGQSVFELYKNQPHMLAEIQKVLAGAESELIVAINGGTFQSRNTPLRDEQGQVIGLIGVATNITHRVQAEAALQKAKDELELRVQQRTAELWQINQRLQQEIADRQRVEATNALLAKAIENAGDAIEITDTNVVIQYVNPACEAITGYTRQEMIGKTPAMLFLNHRHDAAYYQSMADTLASGQVWRGSLTSQRKDGSLVDQEATIAPVFDPAGHIVNYVAVKRDVTEAKREEAIRRRVEASLRRSETRFRRVVDSNMLGIFFAQQNGQITEANDAFLALVGYTRRDLLAGKMNWQQMTPLEHQLFNQQVADELQTFGVTKTYEKEYIRKDGSRIAVLVGIALMEGTTQQDYDVTFVLDITNRKQVEEQLKASLEEKELLLKEVHHRVKNNLQVISSIFALQAQYLKDSTALSILAESQDRIRSIALIHEKLYQRNSFAQIDFAEYLQSLASDLFASYNISPNLIQLNLQVAQISLPLDTAIPCGLLLNELVSNSLKHAFLLDQTGEICIHLTLTCHNQLQLVVRDNGIGLPQHLNLEQTNSLGLRLVRALTRQLEGKLEMFSNRGACFQITFPQPKERRRR
jgi:PAS domain S-box-containing protein